MLFISNDYIVEFFSSACFCHISSPFLHKVYGFCGLAIEMMAFRADCLRFDFCQSRWDLAIEKVLKMHVFFTEDCKYVSKLLRALDTQLLHVKKVDKHQLCGPP